MSNQSVAFKQGAKAKAMGLKLEDSAFTQLREGTKQYEDFLDGYFSEEEDK